MSEDENEDTPALSPREGYDDLAERATDLGAKGNPWGDSAFQEHYAWPATESILPDVSGNRVLLAGCGRGDHVGWFLDRDASVLGLDVSRRALDAARDRFGGDARFIHADLEEPLPLADGAFDLVLSHLALDHVPHLSPVFEECSRVLRDEGELVFTIVHPMRRYLLHRDDVSSYSETEEIVTPWPAAPTVAYHRPFEAIVSALVEAGLRVESFEEPRPEAEYENVAPDRYERASERPDVLCVRASLDQ